MQILKKAIIIGASSGIGNAVSKVLLAQNYSVVITGVEREILHKLEDSQTTNLSVEYLNCMVDDNSKSLDQMVEKLGGLDLLIFSAGIGNLNQNLGFEVENRANKLNILAFTEIANWAFNFFEKQGQGHFVSITSIAGLFGFREAPAYHAAKAYQINYLEGLVQKAKKTKKPIFITEIRPGFVDTQMTKDKKVFWMASAEKAANKIYKTIRKRRCIGYIGRRWRGVAIIIKWMPLWLRRRL